MSVPLRPRGLTLVELLIGALLLVVGIVTLLEAFVRQQALNEHARNLSWAMNDATRVMERLRELNTGCTTPSTTPPAAECGGCTTWDAWLASAAGGAGKSVTTPGAGEVVAMNASGVDPVTVTVAVCWTHRGRALGNCAVAPPTSPAALTTVVTCRRVS